MYKFKKNYFLRSTNFKFLIQTKLNSINNYNFFKVLNFCQGGPLLLLAPEIQKQHSYATVLRRPKIYHTNDVCFLYVVLAPGQRNVYRLLYNSRTVFYA
jgi:hypothetical protein